MKSTVKAAGLILSAVVLGLMTVQGTYALWNATATSTPGTVQAADFKILVNGTEMTTGPTEIKFPQVLVKGKSAYAQITVQNAVNVTQESPLALKLDALVYAPVDNFGGNLTAKTAVLQPGHTCESMPANSYAAVSAPAAAHSVTLPRQAAQTICVQASLTANTPAALMGKEIKINTNLTVAQVAPAAK
ncbi:SipW-dependent-type signal peptide-containing protein [Arthrobacter sp. zg-Y238]|uniref:SipW-dependent-type signal peptide-containing protein n=1 Tax=Arthrobacter sp. zg-Y238 TaxID=2964614 RepID=UPI002107805E|nr:SipW-dependent-type signal peptide-containing protein [Arthrobacter sp. zg-Y238]MCQ1954404.1 SipW-dependent-type signal peptide-containing protein [Arthrobacter sp. zg-Y238]